ncbi:MAG: hypothetical protein ACE5GM_01550 [bacterium]
MKRLGLKEIRSAKLAAAVFGLILTGGSPFGSYAKDTAGNTVETISEAQPVVPVDDSDETRKAPLVRRWPKRKTLPFITGHPLPPHAEKSRLSTNKRGNRSFRYFPGKRIAPIQRRKTKSPLPDNFHPKREKSYWQAILGGSRNDRIESLISTSDGGFILAGYTSSFGAGKYDGWVVKLGSNGNAAWQKILGGNRNDKFYSVAEVADGSLVLAGKTDSFSDGSEDGWVVNLDKTGSLNWQKTTGGKGNDGLVSVHAMSDGGIALSGFTRSYGQGKSDAWVIRMTAGGRVKWQKIFKGKSSDRAYFVTESPEGGLLVGGYTKSAPKKILSGWLARLTAGGTPVWQKVLQGSSSNSFFSVIPCADGGWVLTGKASSWGKGRNDGWVVKLDSKGRVAWQTAVGGSFNEILTAGVQTSDGGYLLVGKKDPVGKDIHDGWVVKLNSTGKLLWQKNWGGSALDAILGIRETRSGFILAGYTESFGAGSTDGWIIKTNNRDIPGCASYVRNKAEATNSPAVVKLMELKPIGISPAVLEGKAVLSAAGVNYRKVCPE